MNSEISEISNFKWKNKIVLVQVKDPVPTDPQVESKSPQKRKKEGFGPWADNKIT